MVFSVHNIRINTLHNIRINTKTIKTIMLMSFVLFRTTLLQWIFKGYQEPWRIPLGHYPSIPCIPLSGHVPFLYKVIKWSRWLTNRWLCCFTSRLCLSNGGDRRPSWVYLVRQKIIPKFICCFLGDRLSVCSME